MGRWYFWATVALIAWLCWHYSFWALLGWAYGIVSVALIIVCFTHGRQRPDKVTSAQVSSIQSQCLEMDGQ